MRNALMRLAPCAVFLSALATAQTTEKPAPSATSSGNQAPVAGMGVVSPSAMPGGVTSNGMSLQTGLGKVAGAPIPQVGPQAFPSAPTTKPDLVPHVVIEKPADPRTNGALDASFVLKTAAQGIEQGKKGEAAGGGGQFVRQALNRAYDLSTRSGDVGSGVAGKFLNFREQVASLVEIANKEAPADAPGLYSSAIETAEKTLPPAAAAAVTQAVLAFAEHKADSSLSVLAQDAYTAATAGQASETRRLLKALDKWEELLGVPGRALIANGDRLKAGVESALAHAANIPAAKGAAPRVWVVKRGKSYVAALPGTTVEKVPGLAAAFALKFMKASVSPISEAYRVFAAAPGARSAIAARVAMGESVPAATLGTGWLWLKYMVMRVWSALTSLLAGRGLPTVANASTVPRLLDAARAWRDAVRLGDAAARAAEYSNLTVSRAQGAFALARRAAAAHEALTGEAGAVSRIDSLREEFEAAVKRAGLSPADQLTTGPATIVSGEGGLRHWASLYAVDARQRGGEAFGKVRGANPVVVLSVGSAALAAGTLAAASKDMTFTVFDDALWASGFGPYGATKLSADLRSTESGGSVFLETERGDEDLAASLDELGFGVTRQGRGLRARLDGETASSDPQEMAELVAKAVTLISGMPLKPAATAAGLERLLSDIKRAPKDAAKTAALFGSARLSRAKTVGWVGDDEAVSMENPSSGVRVIALLDSVTGLAKFARVEPLRVR